MLKITEAGSATAEIRAGEVFDVLDVSAVDEIGTPTILVAEPITPTIKGATEI